jgi:DNA repair protein RadA/Sms
MLLAVLEKRCGFRLAAKDVFLNIAGGIKVDDPAIDLAVAMAILSSNADLAIPKTVSFAAEIGLSGELRPVNRLEQRLSELEKMGYEKIIVSSYSKGIEKKHKHIQIVPCAKIEEVVRAVFA